MSLAIVEPGFLTTIQDLGRRGYQRFGIPVSGAMDRFALMAANALVGNPLEAAGLEASLAGPALQAQQDCLVAAAGSGMSLEVEGRLLPLWMAVFVRRGWTVRMVCRPQGGWSYLAVTGGVDVPLVMGSRATYLRGGFGGYCGRALQPGDVLPLGTPRESIFHLAGRSLPPEYIPAYSDAPCLAVLSGPQQAAFTGEGLETFLKGTYCIRPDSDRMGYRLQGAVVPRQGGADILSQGLVCGAVQVPASGQPIIAMSDCQTTGGYTQIAVVASADLPFLSQCPFDLGEVHFYPTTLAESQQRYRRQVEWLQRGIISAE